MKNQVSAKGKEKGPHKLISHGESALLRCSLWLVIFISGVLFLGAYPCSGQPLAMERVTIDNGMVLLVKENHNAPLVSLFLCVLTGGAREAEFSGAGISHFIEHMVFKGTSTRGPGKIFKEIESFGGKINAFTSYDYTGFEITVPAEFTRPAMEVLADMVTNAVFEPEELEKERQVVLKEIKLNRDDPQRHISRLLWQTAFRTHSYKYPILGEEDLFKGLGREELLGFYQERYTPDNMILVIVGDVNPQQTLNFTKSIFSTSQRKSIEPVETRPEPEQKEFRQKEKKFTSGLTYLRLGYHSVALTDEDCFALDVLAAILGEGTSSRLHKLLCDKKRLAYGVEAINYTPRDPGLFIISCLLEESNKKRLLKTISRQINLVKKKPVSKAELENAQKKIVSDILFSNQTIQAQARDLALNKAVAGNFGFTEKYIQEIKNVTPEDILEVANKYLRQSNLTQVALTPRDELTKTDLPLKLTRPFKLGIACLNGGRDLPDLVNLKPRSKNEVKKYVLDNGVTVLIRENRDMPLVSIKAAFKGGLRAEEEASSGLSNLVAQMLDKGTGTKNAAEIADIVESKGARIYSFSGNNSFGLSLDLLSEDFEQMLTLFADLIINPSFRQKELKKQKKKNLAQIKAREDNIFESGKELLKLTLFKKHPYRFMGSGSEQSLKGLKRRDLINFHRKLYVGRNMVLSIFGDLDAQETLARVKELFAKLDAGSPYDIIAQEEPPIKGLRSSFKSLPKEQSLILVGFAGTTVFGRDRYALELICQVLSQPSGKLFTQIRNKSGLAYTLGAYQVLGLDPGYIVLYVATSAENVETVKSELLKQLRLLKENFLSKEELAQAKRAMISRELIGRQTNSACAMESSLDELYGLSFDRYLKYTEIIKGIGIEDIKKCIDRYFDLDNYAVVIAGPRR